MERPDMDGIVDLADLPQSLVERAAKISGKRSAKAIVRAGLEALAAQAGEAPEKKLNAATQKAIRSKSTRGDKVFADGMDGVAYLRKRFG